ncbi:MAG: mannitol-1-phosphate 5-dehydrogenase [Spirochaetota bacterium]
MSIGTFVQFGAGNIGRSFIGRLFSSAGYETVFLDVDEKLIALINERGSYRVVVKANDVADRVLEVAPVRAVNSRDLEAVTRELVAADYAATSVGQGALPSVIRSMAPALLARRAAGRPPIDIIIAENLRSGAQYFRTELARNLEAGTKIDTLAGLVETSIGKMVPIMPREALAADPLQLFAEPYDTLIVDAKGFTRGLPPLPGLKAVDDIAAYVDRKLFVHNLGHAAAAYLGHARDPAITYLWEALELPGLAALVRGAMGESAAALHAAYPASLPAAELGEHIEDLLSRFSNRALGDTIHRVGRDLPRKLSRDDRIVGACLLAARQGLPFAAIAEALRAALRFKAPDESGGLAKADALFHARYAPEDLARVLREVSGLDPASPVDRQVIEGITGRDA